jgi:hypothetical protein
MPCSPRDLLDLAIAQCAAASKEAEHRCVMSRAYYAALHEVANVFDARKTLSTVAGESTHQQIIGCAKAYSNNNNPGRMYAAEIAKLMPRLRRARNVADYDLNDEIQPSASRDMLDRVSKILSLCNDVQRLRSSAG